MDTIKFCTESAPDPTENPALQAEIYAIASRVVDASSSAVDVLDELVQNQRRVTWARWVFSGDWRVFSVNTAWVRSRLSNRLAGYSRSELRRLFVMASWSEGFAYALHIATVPHQRLGGMSYDLYLLAGLKALRAYVAQELPRYLGGKWTREKFIEEIVSFQNGVLCSLPYVIAFNVDAKLGRLDEWHMEIHEIVRSRLAQRLYRRDVHHGGHRVVRTRLARAIESLPEYAGYGFQQGLNDLLPLEIHYVLNGGQRRNADEAPFLFFQNLHSVVANNIERGIGAKTLITSANLDDYAESLQSPNNDISAFVDYEAARSELNKAVPNADQRKAFLLQVEGQLTLKQIAFLQGVSLSTVASRLRLARENLDRARQAEKKFAGQ